ncbi:mechanosensitive ion channel domain-containing protein [Micromonospora sp. NPDC004540]|uniref:mechanosensitive ion channel domain-containing protein n=1 Tax=Micromonospora sp. NPDC004540 TaxID=3154457 RepID=UPI00339DF9AA
MLVVDGEWGRVEEVKLTNVVIRLWDDRVLILPTTYFTERPFQNWTRNESRWSARSRSMSTTPPTWTTCAGRHADWSSPHRCGIETSGCSRWSTPPRRPWSSRCRPRPRTAPAPGTCAATYARD